MPIPDIANHNLKECAAYCVDTIGAIIERFGPRPPGSDGEKQCQEFLRDELAAVGLSPTIDPFPVAQKAFMAMPMVSAALTVCALPLYWLAPRLSPIPVLLALSVFVCELVFYKHVLTPFFPKSTSHNLWAALAPSGETKRRIILGGHADAAYEWRFHRLFPRIFPLFPALIILSVVYVLLSTLAVALLGGNPMASPWNYVGAFQLAALPGLVVGLLFTDFRVTAPGAGDNLSGSLTVVGLARLLKRENIILDNTEVVFLVTGSEEAGLEGARAFIKAHKADWQDVETVCVAYDTITELAHLAVYVRDLNGRVPHDPRVCALVKEAGKSCGLDLPEAVIPLGSSDGTAFSQAGIPTAAICAMDHAPALYYHNRRDDVDVLDTECLAQALRLSVGIVERYDKEGLPAV
ncbi:MAG TPA: M20/M25/M40 family metallo-hydrolase [Candidatus Hydrogenedentes bacterium]|nr:M20/M25/M40 family metallo-hydrolase [Candidatus Hydrogenedentota bacterium]